MDTSLPPGKELSVGLSIDRPLKMESSGAIFYDFRSDFYGAAILS